MAARINSRNRRRNSGIRSRLGFEQLEDRALLAGNVTALITGGALRLIGESESKQVLIEQNGANGVTVSSLDGSTTINGSLEPVTLTGLRKGNHLAAGDGDDVFRFANQAGSQFDVNGMANLNMGSGNDTLELLNFAAGANVVVNMGAGN